jgi:hypothetical protein
MDNVACCADEGCEFGLFRVRSHFSAVRRLAGGSLVVVFDTRAIIESGIHVDLGTESADCSAGVVPNASQLR